MIGRRWPVALMLWACAGSLCLAGEGERVDLAALVRRVIETDPEIERLRGRVEIALAGVAVAHPIRNPELRLQYSRAGDTAIPDPYTETYVETVRETSSERSRQTDAQGRLLVEESTQSRDILERSTTRQVTPGREVQRTVESTSTRRRQSEVADTRGETVAQTRETTETRALGESVEDRFWRRDPYEGAESYGVEVRVFPRNPLERRARTRRAQSQARIEEAALDAAVYAMEMDVRRQFLELQALQAALSLKKLDLALRRQEQDLNEALFQTGRMRVDEYNLSRVRMLESEVDLGEEEARFDRMMNRLRLRAGLREGEFIDLSAPLAPPALEFESLDPAVLVPLALARDFELRRLQLEETVARAERAVVRAGRLPWPSLLSASYDVDERYGEKLRDEFRVMAGVDLPLTEWLDARAVQPLAAQLQSVHRQQRLYSGRLPERVRQAIANAKTSMQRAEDLSARGSQLQREIRERIGALEAEEDLSARQQKIAMGRLLLLLRGRELSARRAAAREFLELQAYLGTSMAGPMSP